MAERRRDGNAASSNVKYVPATLTDGDGWRFLDGSSHLYMTPSDGPSVDPSVCNPFYLMPKMVNFLENRTGDPNLTLLSVLDMLTVLNLLDICPRIIALLYLVLPRVRRKFQQ